jgi:CRISPR/Cas system-associated exonuclease Cas4 (RecB family)
MFINKVSPSKIKTYDECKAKYSFKYISYLKENYNPGTNTDALQFGSYIHKVLELGFEAKNVEELEKIASDVRENYNFPDSKMKGVPKILNNFFKFNSQLTENVSTEFPFEIETEGDFVLNGIIDRVVRGKTGEYLVIDYKTSRRPATSTDLYTDPQLIMYAYAISKMYKVPLDKVTVAHYYPHLDKLVSIKFGPLQVGKFLKVLKDKVWTIRKKKKKEFPPSQNQFCNWCQYKELCPDFGGTPEKLAEAIEKESKARKSKGNKG